MDDAYVARAATTRFVVALASVRSSLSQTAQRSDTILMTTMTAGMIAAAGAAAGAEAKQMTDTLERFRVADATAADRAQSLESLGLQHMRVVNRLMAAGVILPGARAGRFYLSEIAVAEYRRRQLGQARIMALVGVGLAIAALLAAVIATGHAHWRP